MGNKGLPDARTSAGFPGVLGSMSLALDARDLRVEREIFKQAELSFGELKLG